MSALSDRALCRCGTILGAIAALGFLAAVGVTLAEGIQYRLREEQGLDPVMASPEALLVTYLGAATCVLALVALAVVVAVARGRQEDRRQAPPGPPEL